jgi:hypothetical protein
MKFTYQDGTVVYSYHYPCNFTGTGEDSRGDIEYVINGRLHRDGGLPSSVRKDGVNRYSVNGKRTGLFLYWAL